MVTLNDYREMLIGHGKNVGDIRKKQSDLIMDATWDNDLESKDAYIYDYFNDSEKSLNYGLEPEKDMLKNHIDIKYIVNGYNSDSKDQVSYHIQFRPHQECNLIYFQSCYKEKYGTDFPIGMYIDIPDEKGIYRRWIITNYANALGLQFPTYSILPCNYRFQWIENIKGKKTRREMWGVTRQRNSYNAGIWTDSKFTEVENQAQILLPLNPESEFLYYNQRMIISAISKQPITWAITKINTLAPLGINAITLKQDLFNPALDYVDFATKKMWADYFPTNDPDLPIVGSAHAKIIFSTYDIKIGGTYKTAKALFFDADGKPIEGYDVADWFFSIRYDGIIENADDKVSILNTQGDPNTISIQFNGGYEYLPKDDKNINQLLVSIIDTSRNITTETELNIVSI